MRQNNEQDKGMVPTITYFTVRSVGSKEKQVTVEQSGECRDKGKCHESTWVGRPETATGELLTHSEEPNAMVFLPEGKNNCLQTECFVF
jgi:hypothetical protein